MQLPQFSGCVTEEVQLLTDVIDVARLPEEKGYHSESRHKELGALETRISTAYMHTTKEVIEMSKHPIDEEAKSHLIQRRLFIGAVWIYFMRMARHLSGASIVVTSILADVFDDSDMGINALEKCTLPLAVFVLGIEANTEERRRNVLDLIDRATSATAKFPQSSERDLVPSVTHHPLTHVIDMLKTAWSFDDLHIGNDAERHLDYRHKLHLVFTASEVLPALA